MDDRDEFNRSRPGTKYRIEFTGNLALIGPSVTAVIHCSYRIGVMTILKKNGGEWCSIVPSNDKSIFLFYGSHKRKIAD